MIRTSMRFLLLLACAAGPVMADEPGSATLAAEPAVPATVTEPPPPVVTGRIEGRVHERGSPDPVVGALVLVSGTPLTTESDDRGAFTLALPPGTWEVVVRAEDFAAWTRSVTVSVDVPARVRVALRRTAVRADEVVVRGRRENEEVSRTTLTQRERRRIPGTAGDALRAVATLPGVVTAGGDFSGRMSVRGGGPNDNLYLLDNIPWPVPFHFGGLVSTVASDLLSDVDLYAAGFGARWGNVTDAVLDARTRPGRKDRFHATADINVVTSEVLLEGPAGFGDVSWTLAGRRSYFDLIAKPFLEARRRSGGTTPTFTALPRFWDLGGSLDFSPGPHDRVRVLALATDDLLALELPAEVTDRTPQFSGEFRLHNDYRTGGVRWTNDAIPRLESVLTPYAYDFGNEAWIGSGYGISNRVRAFGLKEELRWDAGRTGFASHRLEFGAGVERRTDDVFGFFFRRIENQEGAPPVFSQPVSTTVTGRGFNTSAFAQDRIGLGRGWTVVAGGRFDRSSVVDVASVTPRGGLEWKPGPLTVWRAAVGLYEMFPGPRQLNPEFGNPRLVPEVARHVVLGVERILRPGLLAKLEVYDKRYRRHVVGVPDDRLFSNDGLGVARGAEAFIKVATGERFFAWLAYARSMSIRKDGKDHDWTPYQYDQPDNLTAIASWRPWPAWTFGAKFHWNSGPLVTPLVGRRQNPDGSWSGIFGEPDSVRLADYLRMDVRADYAVRFDRWTFHWYLELLNVFDRANPQGLSYSDDYAETEQVNNFPFLPSIGLGIEF